MNVSAPLNTLIMTGGAMKSAGTIQRGHRCFGKLGGTLCFHSTAEDPDQTGERDFFDAQTNFRMEDGLKSPIFYHHGLDRFVSVKELGEAVLFRDAGGAQINPDESAIDLSDPDGRKTFERAERGELSWSSGTVAHLVRKTRIAAKSGRISNHIDYWPLGLDASLTPAPAEPRCFATAIKTILRLSTDQIVDAPEHLAEEILQLRARLGGGAATAPSIEEVESLRARLGEVMESSAQRDSQAMEVQQLQTRLIRSQMDVLGRYLSDSKPIVSLPTYPTPVSPVEADDAMKKYDSRQPRDDHGKWTTSGGKLSVGHALHVMKHEGISGEHHYEAVKEAIENGTHQTREHVLKHIDAIHAAAKNPPLAPAQEITSRKMGSYGGRRTHEVATEPLPLLKKDGSRYDDSTPQARVQIKETAPGSNLYDAFTEHFVGGAGDTEKNHLVRGVSLKEAKNTASEHLENVLGTEPGGKHVLQSVAPKSEVTRKAPVASEPSPTDLRAARDKAYAIRDQTRGARERVFAGRDAALAKPLRGALKSVGADFDAHLAQIEDLCELFEEIGSTNHLLTEL